MIRTSILLLGGMVAAGIGLPGHSLPSAAPPTLAGGVPAATARHRAVLQELRRYYADFSARDWTAFASHFWPGATITTVWRPPGEKRDRVVTITIPEFVAQAPEGPGSKPIFAERMTDAKVVAGNHLAQVWARYEARFGDPGKVERWSGTDAFTLVEFNGEWKIVSLAFVPER